MRRRRQGFTLLESLVVMVVFALIVGLGLPALQLQIVRAKVTGAANQVAGHLLRARIEALKLGRQVVVMPDYGEGSLLAFVDENEDLLFDPGDNELFSLPLTVHLMGPNEVRGTPEDPSESVLGLTPIGGESALRVAVFLPDGSIRDAGAFRLADGKQPQPNVLEVRVEPAATARVEIRKYLFAGTNGAGFYSSGGGTWQWY